MLQPLDGPSTQGVLSITAAAVTLVKVGGSPLVERKVISLQPDGKIRVYFGDGVTVPSAATVLSDGFTHPKSVLRSYEAGPQQTVYIVSDTGAGVDVATAERA